MVPTLLTLLLLPLIYASGEPYCNYYEEDTNNNSNIHCLGTDIQMALREFYFQYQDIFNQQNITFTIENTHIYTLDYFPNLSIEDKRYYLKNLYIRNVSLGHIGRNALSELFDLTTLDLSHNYLKNIMFAQYLPQQLSKLILSHNKIVYVDNVFDQLSQLDYLDLSHNRINIIDLKNIHNIKNVDFSWNRIHNLVPYSESRIDYIDLSHNQINEYNEPDLCIRIPNLNLSYNKLRLIKLKCCVDKNYLDLSGNNNLTQFLLDEQVDLLILKTTKLNINTFNVSSNGFNKMFERTIGVANEFILRNSNFTFLNNSTITVKNLVQQPVIIDLSNSSIMDIAEYYFSYMSLRVLDLSHNRLLRLGHNIFAGAQIDHIDLSHSQIRDISASTFAGLTCGYLDVSHNRIEILKNIFRDVSISKLNLSYNPIKILSNFIFSNSKMLSLLDVSNCVIDEIEQKAFVGLEELNELDLSYNRLKILEARTFNNLSISNINLTGNKITIIQSKAFSNLPKLTFLDLSSLQIVVLEAYAFFNLPAIDTIDMRYNNISKLPPNIFMDMNSLRNLYLEGNNVTFMDPLSNKLKIRNLTITMSGNVTTNKISNMNILQMNIKDSKIETLQEYCFQGMYNLRSLLFEQSSVKNIEVGALNDLFNLNELDSQNLFRNIRLLHKHMFRDLKALELLNLSSLSIDNVDSFSFVGLENLHELYLDHNNLTRIAVDTFKGLINLNFLDLSNNMIELLVRDSFQDLNNLKTLFLDNNNMNITAEMFINLPNLEYLNLNRNGITALPPDGFKNLSNLTELHLENNFIDDLPIGVFHYMPNLKLLNLGYNRIKIVNIGALSNMKSLQVLDFSYNDLLNLEHVGVFYPLENLQALYLDGNHLKHFEFERFLKQMNHLNYMGISYNKWQCFNLSTIIEHLTQNGVRFDPIVPMYHLDNIAGVGCIDLCKFVYCSHENAEDTVHYI